MCEVCVCLYVSVYVYIYVESSHIWQANHTPQFTPRNVLHPYCAK